MIRAPWTLSPRAAMALACAALASLAVLAALGSVRTIAPSGLQGDGAFAGTPDTQADAQIEPGYGRLPLAFEPNRGVTAPRVDFIARGQGQALFLSATKATLALRSGEETGAALRMRLLGADSAARPVSEDRLSGTVNYLSGSREGEWRTAIPTFGEVSYAGVYPGIGVRYYGAEGRLEYDFELAPHADPRRIALHFDGARQLSVAGNGDLLVRLPGGTVRERAPIAYQRIDGERQRVAARYVLDGHRVSFALGDYERSLPLTIDPLVLAYSTYVGGDLGVDDGYDEALAIGVDSSGSAYIAGDTQSIDFPTTPGAFDSVKGSNGADDGISDAFVTKLAPDGQSLVYSTYFGGAGSEDAFGIAVDGAGAAYVTGNTHSANFPTTPSAYDTALGAGGDPFVTKLAPDGQSLSYSTYLGGDDPGSTDGASGIAVDSAGSAYVAGTIGPGVAMTNDFPTTPGAFDTTLSGGADVFVTKLSPNGNALVYSTLLGGTHGDEDSDRASEIAVDASGSAYVSGLTRSGDFPTTAAAFDTTIGGDLDGFVTKVAANGDSLAYSTYLGGSGEDGPGGVAVDSQGNAYVGGFTHSGDFPTTPGAFDTTLSGPSDGYVTKLAPDGQSLGYSTLLGGDGEDASSVGGVDATGGAYVNGITTSSDFPTTADAFDTTYGGGGNSDRHLTKVTPSGQGLVWSTYLGGADRDGGGGIAIDPAGNIYAGGWTRSSDFPTTAGAYDTTLGGSLDAFVAKIVDPPSSDPPSNGFAFGKLKRNRKKGTAKLTVEIPGAGELTLAKTKKVKAAAKVAEAAGPLKLEIASRGKAKRKLRRAGTVKVTAEVTFIPTGGTTNTAVKKLRLVQDASD